MTAASFARFGAARIALTLLLVVASPLAVACGDDSADPDDGAGRSCGDGHVDAGEACDDGNKTPGDGCSATCQNEGSVLCGNGNVDQGEACDDGNAVSGDGCSASCQTESQNLCGNGNIDEGEACDDGNTASGDGCSATCIGEAACGNQIVEGDEACDDANDVPFDGCEADCTISPEEVECAVLPPLASGNCEVTPGSGTDLVISGDILGPYTIFRGGDVVVDATGTIVCVGCDCDGMAPDATKVTCPEAVVSPGLINTHEHITFAKNVPYNDTGERYEHRHDWRKGLHGHNSIPAAGSSTDDQIRWGELRFMMSGATSLVGSGSATGFLRNLDRDDQEGLGIEPVHFSTFPLGDSGGTQLDMGCNYPGGDTNMSIDMDDAYLPHVSEGIDGYARNEFNCVDGQGGRTGDEDLLEPQSAFIHGVGLLPGDYAKMAAEGTSLIWSPRSNVTLYGDTAQVTVAARVGVNISLGTDWIPTGSMNMFRELACADSLNQNQYNSFFTDRDLWRMVTLSSARALHQEENIGILATGRVADISIFDAKTNADYRAIIAGEPAGVALVLRGGEAVYGDANVVSGLAGGGCDAIDVCGTQKQLCTQSEVGKSYTALKSSGEVYAAFFCGTPTNEPSCEPSRPVAVNGSSVYGGATANDPDGDGIDSANDNCPDVFNPIRPLDDGNQSDYDGDGQGDPCDVCPLNPNTDMCTAITPGDSDADGVPNADDNCPGDPNPGQEDADNDELGDICDACPTVPNPGGTACPATIYDVKQGNVTGAVSIANVMVTGCAATRGYFLQHKMGDAAYNGPEFSGVFVYDPAANCTMLSPGTRIDVTTATIADYYGQTQLNGATVNVLSTGEALPDPVALSIAEASGTTANEYEAVLAVVSDAQVTSITPAPGPGDAAPTNEFEVEGALRVNDYLFLTSPLPAIGTTFASITGILDFRNGNQKLEPRSAADLVLGNPELAGFTLAQTFVRVGQTNAPSIPVALEVQLTAPADMNTFVTITGGGGSLSVNGGGVTIPTGQSSAVVLLTGISPVNNTTLTATLDGNQDTVAVRVLDTNEAPASLSISPSAIQVVGGGSTNVDVVLDIPAPPGGFVVDLAVAPANAATVPATVTVPADQLSGSFSYVDLNIAATATLTASAGLLMDSATVTVAQGAGLVINEVDYDQPGTDTTEFVEIYNPTASAISLSGYKLVFINGSNSAQYDSIDLTAAGSLGPSQYLVVGSSTLLGQINNGAIEVTLSGSIQNGDPDAVGLFSGSTTVDVLSYGGSVTMGNVTGVGMVNFVEGTATTAKDNGGGPASLCRMPNGADSNDAAGDWILSTSPTPGSANVP